MIFDDNLVVFWVNLHFHLKYLSFSIFLLLSVHFVRDIYEYL